MPRGPNGEWRAPDLVARARHIGRLATGQIEESDRPPRTEAQRAAASARASEAAKARAASQTPERRREIAKGAADARWRPTT